MRPSVLLGYSAAARRRLFTRARAEYTLALERLREEQATQEGARPRSSVPHVPSPTSALLPSPSSALEEAALFETWQRIPLANELPMDVLGKALRTEAPTRLPLSNGVTISVVIGRGKRSRSGAKRVVDGTAGPPHRHWDSRRGQVQFCVERPDGHTPWGIGCSPDATRAWLVEPPPLDDLGGYLAPLEMPQRRGGGGGGAAVRFAPGQLLPRQRGGPCGAHGEVLTSRGRRKLWFTLTSGAPHRREVRASRRHPAFVRRGHTSPEQTSRGRARDEHGGPRRRFLLDEVAVERVTVVYEDERHRFLTMTLWRGGGPNAFLPSSSRKNQRRSSRRGNAESLPNCFSLSRTTFNGRISSSSSVETVKRSRGAAAAERQVVLPGGNRGSGGNKLVLLPHRLSLVDQTLLQRCGASSVLPMVVRRISFRGQQRPNRRPRLEDLRRWVPGSRVRLVVVQRLP